MITDNIVQVHISNPYIILELCLRLEKLGYHVYNLRMFGKLNIKGMIHLCKLNHWLIISVKYKDVTIDYNKLNNSDNCNILKTFSNSFAIDDVITYMKYLPEQ